MFENLNVWEVGGLLIVALLIFGDRLPHAIGEGLRMLRNLRNMARNATGDLSRELGTDIQLEDLHPKTFIRKHLLSEEDEEALRKPLQSVYNDLRSDIEGVHGELKDVAAATDLRSTAARPVGVADSTGSGSGGTASGVPAARAAQFDIDAT
ncbi:sec-independent translocase [Micromonospora sonneratiae]|uniref:Preprotein translocase subunit TatB n=1 Tax=Micromonospora sonneratiae TaxID=1184706 RepID=A0ABW3YGM3_9ACTN